MNLMNRNRQPLSILLAGAILTTITITPVQAEYNPKLGRFMQRDPNDLALLHSTAQAMNAQTMVAFTSLSPRGQYYDGLHLYQFVTGNPITERDPTGTFTLPELTATTGAMAALIALGLVAAGGLINQIAKLTANIAGYQTTTAEFAYSLESALAHGQQTFAVASTLAYDLVAEQVTVLGALAAGTVIVGTEAFIAMAMAELRGDLVEDLTIAEIQQKYLKGSWKDFNMPGGGPDWEEILKMAWKELVKQAKAKKQWATSVKKELMKDYNWR